MRSTCLLLACLLGGACSSPEREEVRTRSYQPLSAAEFAAGDAARHGALVQRERDRVLVERVSGVALEGAGLHILQPLRDMERHLEAFDGPKAGGLHYFRTENRYATDSAAGDRERWPTTWSDWPVSIEPLLPPERYWATLWNAGGHDNYRIELTFDEEAGTLLRTLVGPTTGTAPFTDWCDFTVAADGLATDMLGVLVVGGRYFRPFSVRDVVMAREFPASVVAADGLSRAEAERLLGMIAPERPGLP